MNSSSAKGTNEIEMRRHRGASKLKFGIQFLDDAIGGISPDDLILLGARSGAGKTQICTQIALANMGLGKRVYYIALEAAPFEIESRLKFPLVMERYYADHDRPALGPIRFSEWMDGKYLEPLAEYEKSAQEFFESGYKGLFTIYKQSKFDVDDLIEHVIRGATFADLIIIDHVHYFDYEDHETENVALKKIAKTARALVLEQLKPVILVGHLRKPDRNEKSLAPDYYEFHGSSDLYKIATKIITLGPGEPTQDGAFETFIRIPKARFAGEVSRYIGRVFFSPKTGGYESGYKLIGSYSERDRELEEIAGHLYPTWARSFTRESRSGGGNVARQSMFPSASGRPRNYAPGAQNN